MSSSREIEEEMTVLESMYPSLFHYNPEAATIQVRVEPDLPPGEDVFVRCVMLAKFSETYPNDAAEVEVKEVVGLSDEALSSLVSQLQECAQENAECGMPTMFGLYQKCQEFLGENNAPEGDCVVCMCALADADEDGPCVKLPCSHALHCECLAGWCHDARVRAIQAKLDTSLASTPTAAAAAVEKENSSAPNTPHSDETVATTTTMRAISRTSSSGGGGGGGGVGGGVQQQSTSSSSEENNGGGGNNSNGFAPTCPICRRDIARAQLECISHRLEELMTAHLECAEADALKQRTAQREMELTLARRKEEAKMAERKRQEECFVPQPVMIIRNLSKRKTSLKTLSHVVTKWSPTQVRLVHRDGKFAGMAAVAFASMENAQRAVGVVNDTMYNGRQLVCSVATIHDLREIPGWKI